MIWLAIMFFCTSEHDCKFAYYEAIAPMECEKKLADMLAIAITERLPVRVGTCIPIKGGRVSDG